MKAENRKKHNRFVCVGIVYLASYKEKKKENCLAVLAGRTVTASIVTALITGGHFSYNGSFVAS